VMIAYNIQELCDCNLHKRILDLLFCKSVYFDIDESHFDSFNFLKELILNGASAPSKYLPLHLTRKLGQPSLEKDFEFFLKSKKSFFNFGRDVRRPVRIIAFIFTFYLL